MLVESSVEYSNILETVVNLLNLIVSILNEFFPIVQVLVTDLRFKYCNLLTLRVCIMRSNAHPLKILILNLPALDQGYLYLPLLEKD